MRRVTPAIAMALIIVVVAAPNVFAEDYTSNNFIIRGPAANDFGGTGTSTSFETLQSGNDVAQTEASSTNFILNSGYLFFETFRPESSAWRWYSDEENATPLSPLANEGVAPSNVSGIIKLRITVAEQAGIGAAGAKFRLQYATSSGFTAGGTFVVEDSECTGSSVWCYADGVATDGDGIQTALISDADTCVLGIGNGCGTHNESGTSSSAFNHSPGATTEYEFTIQDSGASGNTVYFFRLYDMTSSSTVSFVSGGSYPSLSTSGASLSFSIGGLPLATSTEGIATDVETTATAIPFGLLTLNSAIEAAQRLTVSTNAGQGYKIFALQRQGLLSYNAEIDPVAATNETPASWISGCTGTAGCFGYHSGEDVLEGGSTRFAANDTYASFSSQPKEIAYNSGPATDKHTDIVYKVEARELQEAGSYESNIVFIVTPVF
jgi:hypothetical protein